MWYALLCLIPNIVTKALKPPKNGSFGAFLRVFTERKRVAKFPKII